MTKEEIKQRIKNKFPEAQFDIVETDGYMTHPITIRCLKCNESKTYTTVSSGILGNKKTTFCSSCKKQELTSLQKQALKIIDNRKDLVFVKWIGRGTKGKVVFKCLDCGKETDRLLHKFVTQERQFCAWCGPTSRRRDQDLVYKTYLENGFEMLESYINAYTPIKFRHSCGFIFKVSPTNLSSRWNCPRCDRKESAGVRLIGEYFDKKGIFYEKEKVFSDWFDSYYRYDFYIPSLKLLIEFMGKQHFEKIDFFLQNRTFEKQQLADQLKEKRAKEKNYNFLSIRYDEVKDITNILDSTTTSLLDVEPSGSKR